MVAHLAGSDSYARGRYARPREHYGRSLQDSTTCRFPKLARDGRDSLLVQLLFRRPIHDRDLWNHLIKFLPALICWRHAEPILCLASHPEANGRPGKDSDSNIQTCPRREVLVGPMWMIEQVRPCFCGLRGLGTAWHTSKATSSGSS